MCLHVSAYGGKGPPGTVGQSGMCTRPLFFVRLGGGGGGGEEEEDEVFAPGTWS